VRLVFRDIIVLAAGIVPAALVYGQDLLILAQKNKRAGVYLAVLYRVGLFRLNQLRHKGD
jgi:hypothetical protein